MIESLHATERESVRSPCIRAANPSVTCEILRSLMSDYPEDLKYSTEHEWVRSGNGNSVRVGITEYAADQLGDIVFVSLPEVGDTRGGR